MFGSINSLILKRFQRAQREIFELQRNGFTGLALRRLTKWLKVSQVIKADRKSVKHLLVKKRSCLPHSPDHRLDHQFNSNQTSPFDQTPLRSPCFENFKKKIDETISSSKIRRSNALLSVRYQSKKIFHEFFLLFLNCQSAALAKIRWNISVWIYSKKALLIHSIKRRAITSGSNNSVKWANEKANEAASLQTKRD